MSAPEMEQARQAWRTFDVNGDGRIDRRELKGALRRFTGKEVSDLEAQRVFSRIDSNHDGRVEWREFLAAIAAWSHPVPHPRVATLPTAATVVSSAVVPSTVPAVTWHVAPPAPAEPHEESEADVALAVVSALRRHRTAERALTAPLGSSLAAALWNWTRPSICAPRVLTTQTRTSSMTMKPWSRSSWRLAAVAR